MEQKYCYFSYCRSLEFDKNIKVLVQIFSEKGYDVKYRSTKLDEHSVLQVILNSDIVIVLVTKDYLKEDLLIKDFHLALENGKTILCLFTPEIDQIVNRDENETLIIMANLMVVQLPEEFSTKKKWSQVVESILERAETAIRETPKLATNNKQYRNVFIINEDVTHMEISAPIEVKVKDMVLERGTIINNKELAIIAFEIESKNYYILIFNKNCDLVRYIKGQELNLEKPKLISSNRNNEILITDDKKNLLVLYSEDFLKKDYFPFGLVDYNDMTVDEETNDIYIVKCIGKTDIKVIDYKTKHLKKIEWNKDLLLKSEKFKPRFIRVVKDRIFVVNASSICIDPDSRVHRVEFGESYIYILDKYSFNIIKFIDLNELNFCQPWNLIIDNGLNVYTTVYKLYDNKCVSTGRFLIKIDKSCDNFTKSGDLLSSFLPNDAYIIKDELILFIENKLYLYSIFFESFI